MQGVYTVVRRGTGNRVYRILALGLMRNGDDSAGQEAYNIVRRNDNVKVLRGWTSERWEAAKADAIVQRPSRSGEHPTPKCPGWVTMNFSEPR